MKGEVLKGHLDLLLLSAVQRRPAHGYAVADILRTQTGGAFDLPEGTLYPALHRLERSGMLASRWADGNGRRRRVYHLTAKGERRLARERQAWYGFARAVHAIVGDAK